MKYKCLNMFQRRHLPFGLIVYIVFSLVCCIWEALYFIQRTNTLGSAIYYASDTGYIFQELGEIPPWDYLEKSGSLPYSRQIIIDAAAQVFPDIFFYIEGTVVPSHKVYWHSLSGLYFRPHDSLSKIFLSINDLFNTNVTKLDDLQAVSSSPKSPIKLDGITLKEWYSLSPFLYISKFNFNRKKCNSYSRSCPKGV